MSEEFFGSYQFDRGVGYSSIDIWEGPRQFRAIVINEGETPFRKEIRDKDPQKIFFRAMALVERAPRTKPLTMIIEEGERFPWGVRTEEDEIKEFVEDFMRTEHWGDLLKNVRFGPEYKPEEFIENGDGIG